MDRRDKGFTLALAGMFVIAGWVYWFRGETFPMLMLIGIGCVLTAITRISR